MNYIEKYLEKFYLRVISNTIISDKDISIYRVFLGLFLLVKPLSYSWLENVPAGLYRPNVLTTARLFETLPDPPYFQIIDVCVFVLSLFIILGIKARYSFLGIFLLGIFHTPFAYGLGKIDHDGVFYLLTLFAFFFTNSGTRYALVPDKKVQTQNIAIAVLAICIVFGMFTAGYEKAMSWIDFDLTTSGVFAWFYPSYFSLGRTKLLADYFFYVPLWLAEIMDYTAVLFEVTGILFLFHSRRSWHVYLFFAAIFHLSNTIFLNINYINHFMVYGIWLISPLLPKIKGMFLIFLIPLFVEDLLAAAVLWIFMILTFLIYKRTSSSG